MCGLAGILSGQPPPAHLLQRMASSIAHRGPDDAGVWRDAEVGIGFGHRRLSIVDLSPLGHQPMASNDGRWVIAYNGEIYNHAALRARLDGERTTAWRGHSDTETLVDCIAAWGLEETLRRAVGMFAIALWDKAERRLLLARDRFGEKPLYYGWVGEDFVFASELRAIRVHPGFANPIDRQALEGLVALSYVGGPRSIYRGLFKLEPGCILVLPADAWRTPRDTPPVPGTREGGIEMTRYWSYRAAVLAGLADPLRDEDEALERLEAAVVEAIAGQAVADVPVGAFLSGGIDSSTVVALYQRHAPGQVKTFTIGFEDAAYNEAEHAKAFAAYLGTVHEERYVSARDAQEAIPLMPYIYDEPFGDSSQIPTYLVSKLAKERVTVALSGDGGDELFGGYNRYFGTIRLWSALHRLPDPLRMGLGKGLAAVPPAAWNSLVALAGRSHLGHFGARVQKVFRSIGNARDLDDYVATFLDEWGRDASPVLGVNGERGGAVRLDLGGEVPDVTAMMYADATAYMRDDILTKVDRAAMAVSLETRVPFLDHRVAELAARIPLSMKIRGTSGKLILRRLLYKHAPPAMFERPKAGFAIPVGEWIRGPLRDWAETLLDPRRLREEGFFDANLIGARWAEHLAGRHDTTASLWTVLMFQAWLDSQRTGPLGP